MNNQKGISPRTRGPRRSERRGFTLIEMLVSLLLTIIMVLSLYGLVSMNQRLTREQGEITAMQQNGRAGMEFMARDIHAAGYQLTNDDAFSRFGVVFPNADCSDTYRTDAISVWAYRDGPTCSVVHSMPQPSSEIKCDDVTDFVDGSLAVIVGLGKDGQFHFDFFVVTHVQGSSDHLQHNEDTFSASYRAGSTIMIIDLISYYLETDVSGVTELVRRVRRDPAAAVATNVKTLSVRYFDDANPPQEIKPVNSAAARNRIRKVEVALEVETAKAGLDTRQKRTLSFKSTVTPRNLLYLRNRA